MRVFSRSAMRGLLPLLVAPMILSVGCGGHLPARVAAVCPKLEVSPELLSESSIQEATRAREELLKSLPE